jgi:multiple sugar transport system substrate-binding protein
VQRRRSRGLTAAVAALGVTASLAACGGSEGTRNVTLTLVAADYGDSAANSSQKYWDRLVKAFEAKNPGIRIKVSVYPRNDVDRKVKDLVAKGKAPDMAQIGAYADYAADGKLYSADELLSISVQADFLPQFGEAGEADRIQYGMPFAASTRLLFYNKTLFKDAGLTPPKTWAELQADARVLKSRGVKIPYALPLGPEEAQAETMMWLLSGGAGYTDSVGTYDIDSTRNVRTFDWLREDLVGEGLTGSTPPGELNRAQAFAAFTRGDVGMLNGHPALMHTAAKKGVKFGMVPMPGINGRPKATMGVTDWMTAFKQKGHAQQIGRFLDYVYSEKNELAFSHEYDLLPVTMSASDAMSKDKEDEQLAGFLEELPNAQLYPVGKRSWAQVSSDIKQQIGKAVTRNGNPASILGQIQRAAASVENAG